MLNKINASAKLNLLLVIMAVSIAGIGIYGIKELKTMNQNTQTLYADRMFPIEQLTTIRFSYAVGILSSVQQLKLGQISFTEAESRTQKALNSIDSNWKAYNITYLTVEEKKLAADASLLINRSVQTIEKLKAALGKKRIIEIDSLLNNELYPVVDPVIAKMNELIHLQVKIGGYINSDNIFIYSKTTERFVLLIVLLLVVAIPFSYYLVRNVRSLIRDLKDSNEKITKSEKKYHSLVEHAGDAIFLINEDFSFNAVNTSASKMLGYTSEEFMGMKIFELFIGEDLKTLPLQIEALNKDKTMLRERKWIRKDGTLVEVEVNVRQIEGRQYLAIARDITERKLIEEAVRVSERKYRDIFENVQDVFYQTSLEGIVLDVSPSVKDHIGYNRQELMGTQVSQFYYNAADREKAMIDIINLGEVKDYELCLRSSLGLPVFVSLNSRLIKATDESPEHIDGSFRNITERKRIEAELAEHKEQLTLFIEHSPASLAMFDNEMNYIATSRRWITDYNVGGQSLVGKSHYEVFPEINDDWKAIHQRCLKGAIEKKEEDSFTRADGSVDWIRWEIRPWHKVSGEIGGIIMFTEVITERVKATELFRHQFENSPDIILIVDKDLNIESINKGRPDGPGVAELIGKNSIEVLPPESRKIAKEAILRCFEIGENQEIENALYSDRWTRSRFVPIKINGQVSKVMVIGTDITEHRNNEEQIRQSEEKNRALIENISDTIVLINENKEVMYQSPSFVRTAGFSMNELNGKTVFEFLHPDDLASGTELYEQSSALPGVPLPIQHRIRHKQGHYIWVEGTVTNLLNNDSVKSFVLTYRNITDRKLAEREREKMTADILQRNKNLEQFTYIVSHNLRLPVANIMGISDRITKGVADEERKALLINHLSDSSYQLDQMLRDLNDILQMKTGVSEKKEKVRLTTLTENVKTILSDMIEKEQVLIKTDFSEVDELFTLKSYLQSIVFNLISNSIKYRQPGQSPQIEVTSMQTETHITLVFKDNGLGIDLSRKGDEVFGLYKRFHFHTDGKGVGLFMVKTQVETLGGNISILSEVNKGTEFRIVFEREEEA